MAFSVTAAYNDDYGRVQISFTGANSDADYAKVESSLDQITWSTIRGGDAVPLTGGSGHIDHYDGYKFGVTNYYRVSAIDSALVTPVADGAMAVANNASVVPALPSGMTAGNMMVLFATHRNTAATVTTPTGWTPVSGGASHFKVFTRVYVAGDTAPTVAFTGGSAGDSCSAFIRAYSNAVAPVELAYIANSSAQDIVYPGASQPSVANPVWLMHEWKQSSMTGITAPAGFTGQWGSSNTAGANAESDLAWHTLASSDTRTVTSGVSTVTGGSAAISKGRLLYMTARPFTDQTIASLTPVLPNPYANPYWIMDPQRPGQNIRVDIVSFSDITNDAKAGVFEVLGRSYPVTVTDVMQSDKLTFSMDVANRKAALELSQRFALGEPMYLLTADPADDLGTFYFTVLSMSRKPDTLRGSWTLSVDVRVVSQPSPSVYGATYIWNDVVTNYATWNDVQAGVASWSNLVDKVSNSTIVVP